MEKQNPLSSFILDPNDEILYFDRDKADLTIPTSKEIPLEDYSDKNLIEEIEKDIKHSRSNFFNVQVYTIQRPELVAKPSIQSRVEQCAQIPMRLYNSAKQQKLPKKKCKIQNHIMMQTYLEKKYDSNIFFKWYTRYVVLTSQKLYLFQDASKKVVLGCFNFKILPSKMMRSDEDNEIMISFAGQCQNLILRAPNQLIKNKWIKAISTVMEKNLQSKKLLMMTSLKPHYQSSDTITEEQFVNFAQTGDILLFLTDHTSGKIQRLLTQSNYDHVGMVIRLNGQVMVFQANQGDGVALYKWKKFVKYFNLYQKISYRKLKCLRKKQLHETFLSFARKNIGKKFDIGAYKLLIKQQSDFDWTQEKQRGYFCSELIAKALKSGGLLDPLKACSRYWPIDFSEGGSLKLLGASLQSEQSILLNKFIKNI